MAGFKGYLQASSNWTNSTRGPFKVACYDYSYGASFKNLDLYQDLLLGLEGPLIDPYLEPNMEF